jgi:5-oxoprolinase (ATP-hydrolysing)
LIDCTEFFRFRIPVQVSILSERRVYHPYGLEGGEDAQCGLNIWVRKVQVTVTKADKQLEDPALQQEEPVYQERLINLGGKNTASMKAGERIIIRTPGGGGWGDPEMRGDGPKKMARDPKHAWRGGSHATREEMALQA